MKSIFEAVQSACERPIWSRGVQLARANAVSIEEESDGDMSLRVVTRGGLHAPLVTLHAKDEDWECSCHGADDPCEHVAAGVIALRQSQKVGKRLPVQGEGRGRIVYELTERSGELHLSRAIEHAGKRTPLPASLSAIASGRSKAPPFVATPADVEIERHLGSRSHSAASSPALALILSRLVGTDRVSLGGQPIRVESEPLGLLVRVVEAPGGVRLFAEQDRRIQRAFHNGVVLGPGAIHPLAPNRLNGREMADLPRGRFYADEHLAELVTDVLPDLEERVPLQIETTKLPDVRRGERPRMRIEVRRERDGLRVLPTLVYGNPPTARIDAGRLIHLGAGEVPIRDKAVEQSETTRLRSELGLRPGIPAELPAEQAIAFATRLAGTSFEVVGNAHHDFQLRGDLEASLVIDDERVELDFDLAEAFDDASDVAHASSSTEASAAQRSGKPTASAEAVLRAWSQGTSVVALDGGGFGTLPEGWLAKYGDRVADLLGALDSKGRVARYALPDLAHLCEDLDQPKPVSLEGLRPLLEGFEGIPRAELTPALEAVLRPYQRQGVDWLIFLRRAGLGALLADDMGLGKTLETLCALEGRTLVVAPTSVLHGWIREIKRFRPSLSVALYHGPGRSLDAIADVTITSYAILRQDVETLTAKEWDCVVLDEAQAIKNPESQIARAAHRLDAKARIALTGTPVENRLEELWSQLHFLNPGILGGRSDFRDRYARPIADGDEEVAARLRQRIRPFILRRLKADVAPELPPLSEIVLDCELSKEERTVYDSVRAAAVREVVEQLRAGGNVMAALEALLRLRQAACHSSLVPGQQENMSSSKLETLYARLEEAVADGHKALVFSQWTSFLDRVEPGLRERGIEWERLDGSTRDRGDVVDRFQSNEGPPIMLLSLRAGGTGLNLTAADHVFLLDPWWNPAVEAQAADRAHRIGQNRPVVVHRLIARDTVEEGILKLHERKRALADAALEDSDGSSRLSRAELLELLESA
jgi:superfamily II DNA or RNA helicase